MDFSKPAGVILAGGRSSRMGNGHKALFELHGKPLLAHVINRVKPHLQPLMLNCESGNDEFANFGLPLIPDLLPDFRGPLTGLYSALQAMADHDSASNQSQSLVLCPCDAPFIPDDLVEKLLSAYQANVGSVVVVSYQGVLQPTFSLWQTDHLPVIRNAVLNQGRGGLKQVLRDLPCSELVWQPSEPSPFFNINTPEELKTAAQWLDQKSG